MKHLLFLLLCPLSTLSMGLDQIDRSSYTAHHMGNVNLYRFGNQFVVGAGDKVQTIASHNTDKLLAQMDPVQLAAFLQGGYLKLSQLSDGDYKIEAQSRGLGGGPVAEKVAYGFVKGLCWSIVTGTIITSLTKIFKNNPKTKDVVSTGIGSTIRENAGEVAATWKAPGGSGTAGSMTGTVIRHGMGERNSEEIVLIAGAASGGKLAQGIEILSVGVGKFFRCIKWLP